MSTNSAIKALMEYYRGEDPEQPLEFMGESWDDLLYDLYVDLPNIAKGVYRKRKKNAKQN